MWIYLLSLFFVLTGGVLQEFALNNVFPADSGNSFIFREHLPDINVSVFANVSYLCQNSHTFAYSEVNYEGTRQLYTLSCYRIASYNHKSFRFTGNRDTEVDGLSLYPSEGLVGEEIYVDRSPFSLFATNVSISSLGWTGNSIWTFFEGVNFDGKHACLPGTRAVGKSGYIYSIGTTLGLPTIGSLVKGCLTQVTPEMRADLRRQAGAAQPWK